MPPTIDYLVIQRPNVVTALRRLGLVAPDVPVLEKLTAENVRGKVLAGSVPPRFARLARCVAEPVINIARHERSGRFSVEEIVARRPRLSWFRVEDLGVPTEPAEIITTRHKDLRKFIRREGLAQADALVEHHAQREHVEGKHAIGGLPYRVGVFARLVTDVPDALPPDLRRLVVSYAEERLLKLERVFCYRVHRFKMPGA